MSSEEFREELRELVKRHNPNAETLRDTADRLENLAEYREKQEDLL